MKNCILSLFAVAAALLAMTACTDDQLPGNGASSSAFTPKGKMVDAYLNLTVSEFSVGSSVTRASVDDNSTDDTEEERTINNFWILQYDAGNKELISEPQYLTVTEQSELANVPVRLSDNDGSASIVYVVTNIDSGTWVEYDETNENYPGFMTVTDLEAAAIPTPKPQRMIYDYNQEEYVAYEGDGSLSIPMSGFRGGTISNGTTVTVDVERMFAKLCIRVDLTHFNTAYKGASVYDVSIGNIPEYCRVSTLAEDNDKAGNYTECRSWLTRAFTNNENDNSNDVTTYPYLIYIPENIQGVNGENDDKAKNVPAGNALSVNVSIQAVTQDDVTVGPYSFTVYPGGDEKTNFNVKRNCIYCLTVVINDLDENELMLPSANCIVCLSGQTTSFYPYYRPEKGGNYEFIDYLNYKYGAEGDENKRINNIKIIWQSKSKAGTGGYIGNNDSEKLVWIDDAPTEGTDSVKTQAEYKRKINVTIPAGEVGNALVGAYNSDGQIIWSWHIWSRLKDDDPGNEGNGVLYYTYEWENSGIKYTSPRVAGYTVMNCNLGALANTPTTSNGTETFGNLYQWGRKDPFPAITTIYSSPNYYNSTTIGTYYGNDGSTAVGITEGTTESELFHSVAGENRENSIGTEFNDYVNYSIHNPTVFICGTKEAGKRDENYASTLNNYAVPADGSTADGNWLLDSEGDHFNRMWGGLDPEKDGVTKVFDTGYRDKQGNIVHMYDDYGEEKSIFDPCPYGWRVSPPDLWLGFTETGLNPETMSEVNYDGNYTNNGFYMYMNGWKEDENVSLVTSFFPCQGTRIADGCSYRVGTCGNYHNATADANDRVNILHLHNGANYFHIFESTYLQYYVKSVGGPVRCVRYDSVSN